MYSRVQGNGFNESLRRCMEMYEARKRTALDGKVWWCAFNMDTLKWSTLLCHGKYKRKKDCEYAIKRGKEQGFYDNEGYIKI